MNERYRWNDPSRSAEDRERRDLEQRAEAGWRGEDYGRYPGDRDHHHEHRGGFERRAQEAGRWVREHLDVSDRRERAESDAPNHAWDSRREPYPKDVGGINRPGQEDRYSRDPLLGHGRDERGFRGGEERSFEAGSYGDRHYGGDYNRDEGRRSHSQPHAPYGQERRAGGTGEPRGGYGQDQYGGRPGGYDDRQQRDYSHQAYGRNGPDRYAEGGYETRAGNERDHRHRPDHDHDDRGWWSKARDEFNAWMGDREAEERRRRDHYHQRDEPDRRSYGSQMRQDARSEDDDTAWRDPISPGGAGYRAEPDRNDGWREDDRRRDEPRDHRPGWFRDDKGRGRPW